MWRPTGLILFSLATISWSNGAPVNARGIAVAELSRSDWQGALISNANFAPDETSAPALEPFVGTIELTETAMTTAPTTFKSSRVMGRSPQRFPAVNLSFFTVGRDLVPVTEEVIPVGSTGEGMSYWDIIVQPGAIWSERDDAGWSRGGFLFALVNSREGETHNGVATFAYRQGKITRVRVQIVQQTAPYYVVDYFTATAQIKARLSSRPIDGLAALTHFYRTEAKDRVPFASWKTLEDRRGKHSLDEFDGDESAADIAASGIDYEGKFYIKSCDTAAGPLPWCDRARFGVWSATKALVNEVALLRLAQKYGPGVFEEKIADFVPEARRYPGWQAVRFGDAINMATGLGNGAAGSGEPGTGGGATRDDIMQGSLEKYSPWYEARSKAEKVRAVLADSTPYPWGPGVAARYRDQDMFMLGVAMDAYVKAKEGQQSNLWSMLMREVYEPIGIHVAPINRTLEKQGQAGLPLMAFGFYPTLSDMVLIARLYQNRGVSQGRQILYAPRIAEILAGQDKAPGLRTGHRSPYGDGYYFNAFWETPYQSRPGCHVDYPQMEGWGGAIIALLPNKMTGIRIGKIWEDETTDASNTSRMALAADRIKSFCE
jgi:hypothetical protein